MPPSPPQPDRTVPATERGDLQARSPEELRQRAAARQAGVPIVVLRAPDGAQVIVPLDNPSGRLTIGRRPDNDIPVDWDPNISRLHAELQQLGGEWVVVDDGLSRNGSWVNGRRLVRRHRLRDGDVVTVGLTSLLFRGPLDQVASTAAHGSGEGVPRLTDAQRQVLVALARPCRDPDERRPPATNVVIGEELCLSVDVVKTHLRTLFTKFRIGDLARNEKRVRLVAEAMRRGVIVPGDLE